MFLSSFLLFLCFQTQTIYWLVIFAASFLKASSSFVHKKIDRRQATVDNILPRDPLVLRFVRRITES